MSKKKLPLVSKEERRRMEILRGDLVALANRTEPGPKREELERGVRAIDRELANA
jgi:hypothetical protein